IEGGKRVDRAERRISRIKDAAIFAQPDRHDAPIPSQPLRDQAGYGFRNHSQAPCLAGIPDAPPGAAKLHGQIRVFADFEVEAADALQSAAAERPEGTRNDGEYPKDVVDPPAERYAYPVFDRLAASHQTCGFVADAEIASEPAQSRIIRKVRENYSQCIPVEGCIDIGNDDYVAGAGADPEI